MNIPLWWKRMREQQRFLGITDPSGAKEIGERVIEYAHHTSCTLSPLGVVLPVTENGVQTMSAVRTKHNHYHKDVTKFDYVDVYRVLLMFNVSDPCIQHAVKKLLVAGGRGAGKDIARDVQEAIDTMVRWQEMRQEEAHDRDDPLSNSATLGES